MTARVSVLMPAYNQAHFIARALDSLMAQTLGEWELIFVDDGSTDATRPAAGPYLNDPRVRYERLDRNRGLGVALNHTLAQATAPLIAYLLEKGTWNELIDLYTRAGGRIYSSPEMRDWLGTVVPGIESLGPALVLDGDLPKRDWFTAPPSPRLSDADGQLHTVVPGRPIGLHPHTVGELAAEGMHLHFYGDFTHGQWKAWIEKARGIAPAHLHLHANVDQEDWVMEFSQYDAGWLHFFQSENAGDIRRANWDDLNYPARIATLAVAGLPLLQGDNSGAIVATQTLARERDLGLFFADMADMGAQLRDRARLAQIRANVWRQREEFTFDYHADRLIAFFREVITHARR